MKNRIKIPDILEKKNKNKIVALTCYTSQFSKILDKYADILLVGDSLGMVVYGHDDTLSVTIRMMIDHGKAVVKTTKSSLVIVDLPFNTYESNKEKAYEVAARILSETGANAIKLEGGVELASTIEFLTKRGIPVMGHVGLMPQRLKMIGSFRSMGHTKNQEVKILNDAIAVSNSGAFSIVIEAVKEGLGKNISEKLKIPTIGIGAGRFCDGQIMVLDDLLGIFDNFTPKFVKKYGKIGQAAEEAVKQYSMDVKNKKFPSLKNVYK